MATTQCPACGLIVPYFCCEGLVCPACGFDEAVGKVPTHEALADDSSGSPTDHSLSLHRPPSNRPTR
jgi:uncharacterized Zn finger protein (UPF0148 family)